MAVKVINENEDIYDVEKGAQLDAFLASGFRLLDAKAGIEDEWDGVEDTSSQSQNPRSGRPRR